MRDPVIMWVSFCTRAPLCSVCWVIHEFQLPCSGLCCVRAPLCSVCLVIQEFQLPCSGLCCVRVPVYSVGCCCCGVTTDA